MEYRWFNETHFRLKETSASEFVQTSDMISGRKRLAIDAQTDHRVIQLSRLEISLHRNLGGIWLIVCELPEGTQCQCQAAAFDMSLRMLTGNS